MERFWKKVHKTPSCWLWIAARSRTGYGMIQMHGKNTGAHRVSWALANGPIPDGLWVLHSCDKRYCVNPAHLRLGTIEDNSADAVRRYRMWWRGKRKTHCIRGHEYTAENTHQRANGLRYCKACRNARRAWQRLVDPEPFRESVRQCRARKAIKH